MSIAGELNTLVTTKAVQRRKLEAMFPYIDWDRMPFSCYGDFFALKNILDDCGALWTNAYGRSNSEDASTRDILPDYSGNGRDIRLYNFGFAGMSGYGGYVCNFKEFNISTSATGLTLMKSATRIRIEVTEAFSYSNAINMLSRLWDAAKGRTVKVTSTYTDIDSIQLQYSSQGTYQDIALNDKTFIPAYSGTVDNYIYIKLTNVISKAGVIDIELLPEYPGALVSDGIDDYGQCVKDFALPDDYTVVAVRKILSPTSVVAGKSRDSKNGAFLFEDGNMVYNYGISTAVTGNIPALFSYQTKSSYNGVELNVGDGTDTEEDKFMLFMMRPNADKWSSVALHSLGIFTRTLTDEEMRVVKNCMMAEWAAMTGELDNVTYVADWDGKDRSNDEEEPMRSQWIDKKTGKVINLSNFGFSGMSGWNGYAQDFKSDWLMNSSYGRIVNDQTASIDKLSDSIQFYKYVQTGESMDMRIRITGLSRNISEGKAKQMRIYSRLQAEPNITVTEDGVYAIHAVYDADDSLYFYIPGTKGEELVTPVTIEQLPLYPGALVSDGVDDYGQTAEAISEEVGTVLVHMSDINSDSGKYYILFCDNNLDPNRYALFKYDSTQIGFYAPEEIFDIDEGIFAKSKSPVSVNTNLFVCAATSWQAFSRCALYRLILIQEQLDDAAVEFLKWKVDKEYRDWCRANGYEYAINQLTE